MSDSDKLNFRLRETPRAIVQEPYMLSSELAGGLNGVSALDIQVAGNHYKTLAIQPVTYIHANNIGYFEGSVIKYVTRWKAKGGIADLEKARHFLDLLIELEKKAAPSS